ncbi:hypothetical protein KJS94_04295 [Flavihumibacter rivuli]|uniref:family 6 glucosyltransferase n=1 Tax=Flavihumibacter rivuli TaxID=2838156 RepID=UPI001BDE8EA6|nr:family 6 glucosyltransferase [Flavihumibacter rivuli]ULQ57420.1 hypothetical protein KJS94_04295 [Flavihumibacter rivuli]
MKIGVLYICTGKYDIFWKDFYLSSEEFFLPGNLKEYFVFTDASVLYAEELGNVHKIFEPRKGWPYDTLMRFHCFSKVIEKLRKFDYVFFFNANALFVRPINQPMVIPSDNRTDLIGVIHPGYYLKRKKDYPYERDQRRSKAYIGKKEGNLYYQGCLNGGSSEAYIQLIQTLKKNVQEDLDKGIIAKWHDESHLNRYFIDHPPFSLDPSFSYPEGSDLPFRPMILMRDKNRLGGHDFLRGTENSTVEVKTGIINRLRKMLKRLWS